MPKISIVAIGYGLSNSSFALALNSFFRLRLNRASGVAMTIAGIGLIVYPPLIQHLLDAYDVNGCMLIIGGLAMNMLVAAVLLQPVKWHLVRQSAGEQASEFLSKCSLCNPRPLPTVQTFQSIGKFSDISCTSNPCVHCDAVLGHHAECRFHFPIDHDIDTQSIYGFDQIVHRQPSFALPNQEQIARNFSRRTLCHNSTFTGSANMGLGLTADLSLSNANFGSSPMNVPPPKPLRWFETGSSESVHLGLGLDRKQPSSVSPPFKRESMLMLALKKNAIPPAADIEDAHGKPTKLADDTEEVVYVPEAPPAPTNDNAANPSRGSIAAVLKWFIHFFDLDLLRDKIYLNLMLGMAISIFGEINFAILTPFILTDLKYGTEEIPMIISVTAIADLISRFFSPFVADYFRWSTRTAYLVSLILLIFTRTGLSTFPSACDSSAKTSNANPFQECYSRPTTPK